MAAVADALAQLGPLELQPATCAEGGGDPCTNEQRPHEHGPEDGVRNEELAGHNPGIGPVRPRV